MPPKPVVNSNLPLAGLKVVEVSERFVPCDKLFEQ